MQHHETTLIAGLALLGGALVILGCEKPLPHEIQVKIDQLQSREVDTRRRAARQLSRFGDARVVPALVRTLRDPDPLVRVDAAWAIGQLGREGQSAVRDLVRVIATDPDPEVQRKAALAIGWIGSSSSAVIPDLLKMLQDGRAAVRANAAVSLGWIGAHHDVPVSDIVPALIALLGDPDDDVVFQACEALGAIGPRAEPAVPALRTCLDGKRVNVKWGAERALKGILPKGEQQEVSGRYLGMRPGDVVSESTFTVAGTTSTFRLLTRFWKHEGEEDSDQPAFYKVELHGPDGKVALPCDAYGGQAIGPQVTGGKIILFCADKDGGVRQIYEYDIRSRASKTITLPSEINYHFGPPAFSPDYLKIAYAALEDGACCVRVRSWPDGRVLYETSPVSGLATDASFDAPTWLDDERVNVDDTYYGHSAKARGAEYPRPIRLRGRP